MFYLHHTGVGELLAGLDRGAVLDALADQGVIVRHHVMEKGEQRLAISKTFRVPNAGRPMRLWQIDYEALTRDAIDPPPQQSSPPHVMDDNPF